jgi:hypothetical protein
MEAEKQWAMVEETQRNDKAKDPKEQNPISNTSNNVKQKRKGKREDLKKKTSAKKQVSQTIQED